MDGRKARNIEVNARAAFCSNCMYICTSNEDSRTLRQESNKWKGDRKRQVPGKFFGET